MVGPLSVGVTHRCNGMSRRGWVLYGRVDAVLGVDLGCRREHKPRTNIESVYYKSISVTPIMGAHRQKTPKVVQFTELKWCESTPPNAGISRYVPWKYTFLIRVTYSACCRRRVMFLSSSPLKHGSATFDSRNTQTLPSKATRDPSVVNEEQNIRRSLMSTISFKSLQNIRFLKTPYPDDHMRRSLDMSNSRMM